MQKPTPEAAPGVRRALTIVIPWLAVQLPSHGQPEQGKIDWLPPLAEGEVTDITLFFTAPHIVAQSDGLIASAPLRDGSTVWLGGATRPALPDEISRWSALQEKFRSEAQIATTATPDADIRAVIGGDMPDGSPWLLDLPIR